VRKGEQETKIFGSVEKKEKFAREDRRFHRSYYRTAKLHEMVAQAVGRAGAVTSRAAR
jgi:hypothetical protein